MHVFSAVVEDIVQAVDSQYCTPAYFEDCNYLQLDSSLSCAHTKDHTEADVLCLLNNVLASKQVDNLEELTKVKLLLTGNNI